MWPYWLLFLTFAVAAMMARPRVVLNDDDSRKVHDVGPWIIVFLLLTFLIGLRYQVGGDWASYIRYIFRASRSSLADALGSSDPGYEVLNVISVNLGFGVFGVNVVSGAIFTIGLVLFCRSLPRPWVAVAVAIPYMVIVVAMGYTRQSVALGFALLGFVALGKQNFFLFVILVFLGATFHKTAVLLIPIAALTASTNRFVVWTVVVVGTAVAYRVLLEEEVDRLITNYVEASYQSSGAFIRLAMNAVPAALFLVLQKRFDISESERKLWKLMSVMAIGLFLAFFVTSASTALDRVALYIIPLQLFVFAHLPNVLGRNDRMNMAVIFPVLLYYSVVLFVWLNFATHSRYWIPYSLPI